VRPGPRQKTAALISLLLYLGISLLSSLPGSALPARIPDIIPHFCEYALLGFFFMRMFSAPLTLKTVAGAFAALILLGLLDEWHQAFVPGRVCSLKDLLFDAAGGFAGITACLLIAGRRKRPPRPVRNDI
jgi:VanZ family protein